MEIQVVNFKAYSSGALVGFFDAVVGGLVVTGCKAFRKEDKLWFSWPAEKTEGKDGADVWRDIVTAADPVMRHLQGLVRGQLRALLDNGKPAASRPPRKFAGTAFRTPEGEDLGEYRSKPGDDGIPY
jgi:hypothetical protein